VTPIFIEVGHQVAVGEEPEMNAAVVRDDRKVEAERMVDRDQRPDVEELGAAGVERKLRAWDVGGDEVDH
jgi:hypothetical protein